MFRTVLKKNCAISRYLLNAGYYLIKCIMSAICAVVPQLLNNIAIRVTITLESFCISSYCYSIPYFYL